MKEWNYENEQWHQLPDHLKHLPLFTRHIDWTSWVIRALWALFLKYIIFKFVVKVRVMGDFEAAHRDHKKLIIISNHSSHFDTPCITAAVPFKHWLHLYVCAAKDYWFTNWWFTFFSKHCIGAIPLDRKENKSASVQLCNDLLSNLDPILMVMFPEGSRSEEGLKPFKAGISIFSQTSNVPILFMHIEGANKLMPKGKWFRPGTVTIHIGPVQPPAPLEEINANYQAWMKTVNPTALIKQP